MPQTVTFDIPIPGSISPHRDSAREQNIQWVTDHRLVQSPAGIAEYRSWDLADAAARIYHGATHDALVQTLNFFSIGFLFDDQFDPDVSGRLGKVAQAAAEMAVVPFRPVGAPAEFSSLITEAWAAFWPRIANATPPVWQARFAAHFARWLTAHVWETRLTAEGVTLTPAQYVRLRRQSVGLDHSYDIAEWTYGFELPLRVAAHPLIGELRTAATDTISFMNDIHSYEREMHRREAHNIVAVLTRHEGLSVPAALNQAGRMARDALAQFVQLEQSLPSLCEELSLNRIERADTQRFVHAIQDWIRGNHDWAIESGRYRIPGPTKSTYADDLLVE